MKKMRLEFMAAGVGLLIGLVLLVVWPVMTYISAVSSGKIIPVQVESSESTVSDEINQILINGYGFALPSMAHGNTITYRDDMHIHEFSAENTVTVAPLHLAGILEESYGVISEESITIDTVPARRILGSSAKDGSPLEYILIEQVDTVILIRGTADFLDSTSTEMQL